MVNTWCIAMNNEHLELLLNIIKWVLLAGAGTAIPAVVLNVEIKLLPWVGLCGAMGYLTAILTTPAYSTPGYIQVFLGALVVGIGSELFARLLRAPALTFCIPAIFPLVPGISAYRTLQLIVSEEWSAAAATGLSTAASAFSIAFGLMLVASFFRRRQDKRA